MEIRNGVFYGAHNDGVSINLEIAKQILKDRIEYCEGFSFPAIVFDNGLNSIDKTSREYLSSLHGCQGFISIAVVTEKSFYFRVMANFIVKVTKQPIPVKIFEDIKPALEWLEQYK